jgi:adenylosuccinate synthase
MPSLSVFGAQWGDEGKGKIIDRLAREASLVVRYQGGANAGHTVVVGGEKYVLHLVPSGFLHHDKINVIAGGVVVDPIILLEELDGLAERGIEVSPARLRLCVSAQVILDYHRTLDGLVERWKGDGRIGTTGRGIGPAYQDKAARTGLRVADLIDPDRLRARLAETLPEKNALIEKVYGEKPFDLEKLYERYAPIGERLAPFAADTGAEIRAAYGRGELVLFEGAQGTMLDIDHGTYPYVTSSNTGTAGIGTGAGFPPNRIDRAWGIAKAYCTRVGEGPFPSEAHGAEGEKLQVEGNEFGATTGRPRRCGWFDVVAVRYALELNGATGWVMTNLDVLSAFDEIKAVTGYRLGGELVEQYPVARLDWKDLEVVQESRPGWAVDITGVREYDDLPAATRDYVEWLEKLCGVPIVMLSVGPDREQVILRKVE